MQPFGVVVHLDIPENFAAGILSSPEGASFQHFRLKTAEKPRDYQGDIA